MKKRKQPFTVGAVPAPDSELITDRLYVAIRGSYSRDTASLGDPVTGDIRSKIGHAWHVWQNSPLRYSKLGSLIQRLVTDVEHQLYIAE